MIELTWEERVLRVLQTRDKPVWNLPLSMCVKWVCVRRRIMQRVLGRSGIQVSALGMGCWAVGGPFWDGIANLV
jgi:hypothetical protein